jgi:hypothetical protein
MEHEQERRAGDGTQPGADVEELVDRVAEAEP